MKKIPTLFEREFEDHKVISCKPVVTPGLEWVLNGEGIATVKYDGSCCAIFNGIFYKSSPLPALFRVSLSRIQSQGIGPIG